MLFIYTKKVKKSTLFIDFSNNFLYNKSKLSIDNNLSYISYIDKETQTNKGTCFFFIVLSFNNNDLNTDNRFLLYQYHLTKYQYHLLVPLEYLEIALILYFPFD